MEGKRVSAEELKQALEADYERMIAGIVEAMNVAQGGRIIADTEEPVRDAHAKFRQEAYEQALRLLQQKQEAFSPSPPRTAEQGQTEHDASDDQRTYPGT